MLTLPKAWLERWQGKDIFNQLFELEGRIYRDKEGRKTLRFTLDGKGYFAKLHRGVGWKEILKNILQFRLPVLSAQNEWEAIQRLDQLGIKTMPMVGYGKRGRDPARLQSFIITEELTQTISLEDFCRQWPESPPDFALKRALTMEVAKISRTIHKHGMNHRDFYICHFLLDISGGQECIDPNGIGLHLIDLHRMQKRHRIPRRSRIKDLAALYFSCLDIGLTRHDQLRFIREYSDKSLRQSLKEDKIFWWQVKRRGKALYRKFLRNNKGLNA